MSIDKVSINPANLLYQLTRLYGTRNQRTEMNQVERELAQELKAIIDRRIAQRIATGPPEEEENVKFISESSKSDPDYEPGNERLEGRGSHFRKAITFEMKRQVVQFCLTENPTPTFRHVKRRFRWIKDPNQLARFKRQVESYTKGVLPEKRAQARQHKERVAEKYRWALGQGFRVSTIDIYGWAAEEARKIGYTRFKGSNGWLTRFRAEYNIQPRRDNKLLIGNETQSEFELEESRRNSNWNDSNQDLNLKNNSLNSSEPLVLLEVHETSIFEPN